MKKRKVYLEHDIKDVNYPTDSLNYFSSHYAASLGEIEKYGVDKFDRLNKVINNTIPQNELAGSHHKKGIVEISDRIPSHPKWMRREVQDHEEWESDYMGR